MRNKTNSLIYILIFVLLIAIILYYTISFSQNNIQIPDETHGKTFCKPEDRNAEICTEIYQPVCGWVDPAKIQCIRYPCAVIFGNPCSACMDENVLYYTEGECPE